MDLIRNMYVGVYVPYITCEQIWHIYVCMEYIGNIKELYREQVMRFMGLQS